MKLVKTAAATAVIAAFGIIGTAGAAGPWTTSRRRASSSAV